MATPNYGYEKRQKEQAKKRKKEDKLKAKAERKLGDPGYDPEIDGITEEPESTVPEMSVEVPPTAN